MIHKKANSQQLARTHLSLASRFVDGALRASVTAAVLPAEEPWRNKKLKGNHRGKRRK